jgi:hypothetical protein
VTSGYSSRSAAIPSGRRRNEKELWAAFEKARPALLGALLGGLVSALATVDTIQLERLPRMADFALWVSAAEPGLGWEPGSFIASYASNRDQAHELAVDTSPAGQALVELADIGFHGTAADLLARLNERVDETRSRQRGWPASARAVSGIVRRLAPNLRELGYDVAFSREPGTARRRIIELQRSAATTVPTDPTAQNGTPRTEPRDGWDATEGATDHDRSGSIALPWYDPDGGDGQDDHGSRHPDDSGPGSSE